MDEDEDVYYGVYDEEDEIDEDDDIPVINRSGEVDVIEEGGTDDEEQQFDITLAATHSYMGHALSDVGGRVVLEAGWAGRVPVLAHHGCVFPGETVPMLLNNEHDAAIISETIAKDKLFGLLCPDESCQVLSGYGVLCEVYEAALGPGAPPTSVSFKARAVHRFRIKDMPKCPLPVALYVRVRHFEVRVLPDVQLAPLQRARRLSSRDCVVRRLDAVVTPWPQFVFEIFDYWRMRDVILDYFRTLGLEKMLPEDAVSLSFWVASNLTAAPRDRLALFVVDNALLRLHMECRLIGKKSALCCTACSTEIARREHVFAMSSAGAHGNYTNLGGHVHGVLTVSAAHNTRLSGAPSAEYSWFPGYAWSVAVCGGCTSHVGWRFDARRRNLRPQQFYGLCRNYVQPREVPPASQAPL